MRVILQLIMVEADRKLEVEYKEVVVVVEDPQPKE
jgi:hypothetical protein